MAMAGGIDMLLVATRLQSCVQVIGLPTTYHSTNMCTTLVVFQTWSRSVEQTAPISCVPEQRFFAEMKQRCVKYSFRLVIDGIYDRWWI